MPRTAITVQTLDTKAGEVVTFVNIDVANGMQAAHTGKELVFLRTDAGESVNITLPSFACGHGRTETLSGSIAASELKTFGPFDDPKVWGDGAALLYLDFNTQVGTVQVAVVKPKA